MWKTKFLIFFSPLTSMFWCYVLWCSLFPITTEYLTYFSYINRRWHQIHKVKIQVVLNQLNLFVLFVCLPLNLGHWLSHQQKKLQQQMRRRYRRPMSHQQAKVWLTKMPWDQWCWRWVEDLLLFIHSVISRKKMLRNTTHWTLKLWSTPSEHSY